MSNLELYYAVKPLSINQPFGANAAYYSKFLDSNGNPEKGHMGIDFMASHGTPVYAPCDGTAFYLVDAHGGDGIYIRTPQCDNGYGTAILWHLCSKDDPVYKPLIPTDGSTVPVKRGQLIGYADNTGAPFESSGDHLHFGFALCDEFGTFLNRDNGYGGCVDPAPYFNGFFAQDADAVVSNLQAQVSILSKVVALLKKLLGK